MKLLCRLFKLTQEEAVLFNTQSQKNINDAQVLKEQLMSELAQWIVDNGFKQVQAAEILNTTRPRVSDLMNKKANKFTFDASLRCLVAPVRKLSFLLAFSRSSISGSIAYQYAPQLIEVLHKVWLSMGICHLVIERLQ